MRFGYVPGNQLHTIDFSLPPDASLNRLTLKSAPHAHPKLYIGCGRWGMPEWKGTLFPSDIKEKDFPQYYIRHFNCIELNATLYRVYPKQTFEQWAALAGDQPFKYCAKLPAQIIDALQHKAEDVTESFLYSVKGLGKHLGICFLQLGEFITADLAPSLKDYIKNFPSGMSLFIELRHPSWFAQHIQSSFFSFLQQMGTGLIITDTPGRRDALHMCVTVPKTLIRFTGSRLQQLDRRRLGDWKNRLQYWFENGLEEAYVIMHAETYSPELALWLRQEMQPYYVH